MSQGVAQDRRVVALPMVVVGSMNKDVIIKAPRRPAPGETVTGAEVVTAYGGKGANQAVCAARLGASVTMIGRVGADDAGAELCAALDQDGVDTTRVRTVVGASTGTAYITVTRDGENSIIVASGANASLHRADLEVEQSLLKSAGVLLLQLEIPDDAVEAAARLAGDHTLVILNAAPFRELSAVLLRRLDVLVLNAIEAAQLLGQDADLESADDLVELGPRATVITRGAFGTKAFCDGKRFDVEAKDSIVLDTTGAGDAFVGALGAWLQREQIDRHAALQDPLRRAITAATAAASYAVARLGAQSSYGSAADVGAPWS